MALSLDSQKIYNKLVELLRGGKKLDISLDELKKKAGTPNISNSTVSALISREQAKGNFKNLTIKQFAGGLEVGVSKHDATYNKSKAFRNFYNEIYKTPWNEIDSKTNLKSNAYQAFLRDKIKATGFTLTPGEAAKKLGITANSLQTYEAKPDNNTSSRFIRDHIQKQRTTGVNPNTGRRETVVRYKDPGKNILRNWNVLQESSIISDSMVDRIKEYDKAFRKALLKNKKLPDIGEVIQKTSMKTPSQVANTEALYSRLLRGETFRTDVGIGRDVVLGKKIINELAINSSNNARRSAFYRLALDNINKMYPQGSGNLETFKVNFRNELKNILGIKGKKAQVPFSINEVIGLSTGQSRGVQPFSVFVDAVETSINKGELSRYQGQFSKKLDKIQTLLSGKNPKVAEAEIIASSLDANRKTLVRQLTERGFTRPQINQLNLPDIKVGENVLETYKAKDLARYKEAGVDIGQFAKDKKFYIDIKKAKPFWESNVNNTVIAAARNNVGNICNIFKGRVAYSADGGRIGFQGGCAGEMTAAMKTNPQGTLQQITKTEGILPKFQNAATTFLKTLGRGGVRAAPYAALAAVGAGIEPLVKQFRIDDPTTYLTDESQMKGMLLATIEGETPKVDQEILKWQYPGLAAATVAGAVPGARETYLDRLTGRGPAGPAGTKLPAVIPEKPVGKVRAALGIKGVLGKALGASFSPLAVAATLPISVAAQRKGGTEWGDIATDPTNWMAPAFASTGAEMATRGVKNPLLLKALRMGMSPRTLSLVARRFGIPGLMVSGGMWGYDKWKNRSVNDPED